MEKLIKVAAKELGIKEIPTEEKNNPQIMKYSQETGLGWIENDEVPWCSVFMNWVALKANFERSGKANARSWLNVGKTVEIPEPGDVVIYWRKRKHGSLGHVGLFMGYTQDRKGIFTLGGNQSNAVSIKEYSLDQFLGFRRLGSKNIRLTTITLKRGMAGPNVAKVQDALKMAKFDCGKTDGDYGPKTERAVKALQAASNGAIPVNGIFDKKTKDFLKKLIQEMI